MVNVAGMDPDEHFHVEWSSDARTSGRIIDPHGDAIGIIESAGGLYRVAMPDDDCPYMVDDIPNADAVELFAIGLSLGYMIA